MKNSIDFEDELNDIAAALKVGQLAAERGGLNDDECAEIGWLFYRTHQKFNALKPTLIEKTLNENTTKKHSQLMEVAQ
jgi:hypothetical protein